MLIYYRENELLRTGLGEILTEFTVMGLDVLILLTKHAYKGNAINRTLDIVKHDRRTRMTRSVIGSVEWDNTARIDWFPLTTNSIRGMHYHHIFVPMEARNDPEIEMTVLPCLRHVEV